MALRQVLFALLIAAAITFFLWIWFHPRKPVVVPENMPANIEQAAVPSPTPAPSIAPPTAEEAQEKLDLIFKKAVVLDPGATPSLVTGDFNTDSSTDLVAAVKPRKEGLAELNSEVPTWIAQDATFRFDPAATSPPPPVRFKEDDSILVIVHGYKAQGWRHPDALQAYVLAHARGDDMRRVSLVKASGALGMDPKKVGFGDVLAETRDGHPGAVVWTSSRYIWWQLPKALPASGSP